MFLGAVAIVAFLDPRRSYESLWLAIGLNFFFSVMVSLFIAYLVGRSFLVRGSPGLLMLGCGVVVWGFAGIVGSASGWVGAPPVAIHNTCAWLAAACHLAGVVLSLRSQRTLSAMGLWLAAAYTLAVGVVGLVTLSALAGWLPAFSVPGGGWTALRQVVLGSAIAMFILTAILLRGAKGTYMTPFTYWYALALALIAVGLFGVMIQPFRGSLMGWTGRAAQLLSGVYMLVAAITSVRESRVWGITLEAALQESEAKLRAVFRALTEGVVFLNPQGNVEEANDAVHRLHGHDLQELIDPKLDPRSRIIRPDGTPFPVDEQPAIVALRTGKMVRDVEMGVPGSDGKLRWRLVNAQPVYDDRGTLLGAVASFFDITVRKQAEEALRELNATLESRVAQRTAELQRRTRQLQKLTLELTQAEERERRRIAVILHEDLQQQIAGAKFHLTLVRNRAQEDRQRTDVDRVDEMLKDAIDKSRTLSHDLSPAVLHMNDLAEALGWLANRVQTQQGLTAHLEVRGDMVLRSEALAMFLFRAAQEMLFNVVKHAGVCDVTVRVRRIGHYVSLSVIDQGCGFDPQELNDTPGLGLLSIRERVELLGGRLKIKSAKGQGAALRIVVPDGPEAKDREEKAEVAIDRPTAVSAAPASGLLRVLLVDDHAMVRQGLGMVLQETPDIVVVGEAANGREAIDLVNELRPDVVIMDVAMPVMSGEEATRQIKTHLPQTRVIALSMYDEPEKREMMYRAGAEGYVLKTASSEELLAAIRGKEPSL